MMIMIFLLLMDWIRSKTHMMLLRMLMLMVPICPLKEKRRRLSKDLEKSKSLMIISRVFMLKVKEAFH